jgi:hypothetical protein
MSRLLISNIPYPLLDSAEIELAIELVNDQIRQDMHKGRLSITTYDKYINELKVY